MPRCISTQVDDTTYENLMAIRVHSGHRLAGLLALLTRNYLESHQVPPLEGEDRDRLRPRGHRGPTGPTEEEVAAAEQLWVDIAAMCDDDDRRAAEKNAMMASQDHVTEAEENGP